MCDCITLTNKALEPYNTQVECIFNLFDKTLPSSMVVISTMKKDAGKRGKPKTLVAAFCPLCGEKYELDAEEEAK